eukprot:6187155-Pleurochrysis_carterae.AAC.2
MQREEGSAWGTEKKSAYCRKPSRVKNTAGSVSKAAGKYLNGKPDRIGQRNCCQNCREGRRCARGQSSQTRSIRTFR